MSSTKINKISFCISTNGAKPDKTSLLIASIRDTMLSCREVDYEIILTGSIDMLPDYNDVLKIDAKKEASNGMLAGLRYIGAQKASGNVLVFCDDDLLFSGFWGQRLIEFSNNNFWLVLGNKILLPNGHRYWDRAICSPHQMVDYDHPEEDERLYQCGCFWIIHMDFYKDNQWDPTIEFYADKNGGINEDIELSNRVYSSGSVIKFDKENLIWHNDDSYVEKHGVLFKIEEYEKMFYGKTKDFLNRLNELT